jgi:hypothetical protein
MPENARERSLAATKLEMLISSPSSYNLSLIRNDRYLAGPARKSVFSVGPQLNDEQSHIQY